MCLIYNLYCIDHQRNFSKHIFVLRPYIELTLWWRRKYNHYLSLYETRNIWYLSIAIIIPISFLYCYVTRPRRLFRCSIGNRYHYAACILFYSCIGIRFVVLRDSSFYSIIPMLVYASDSSARCVTTYYFAKKTVIINNTLLFKTC